MYFATVSRCVYKLDLSVRTTDESCTVFNRYLSYPEVISGTAIENAKNDYRDVSKQRQIETTLPEAWLQLIKEQDEILVELGILALRNSGGRNAVSELHGDVSRKMWNFLWKEKDEGEVPITYITNGVHVSNWMARRMRVLLDKYLGADWMDHLDDPDLWTTIDNIPDDELWGVRLHLKRKLTFYLRERVRDRWTYGGFHPVQVVSSGVLINPYALTIGFARRFATYKRASLILSDVERLLEIVNRPNMPVQIIFAGKAHPADEPGKLLIQQVYRTVKRAETGGRLVLLSRLLQL